MPPRSESVPKTVRATYDVIVALINPVCDEHLNAEYAGLSRQLAAALARKRPSPLTRGQPAIWACAIVYTIGMVNFLFDKSQTPHLRADDLCRLFGVSPSSASAKSQYGHSPCAARCAGRGIPPGTDPIYSRRPAGGALVLTACGIHTLDLDESR